MGRDSNFTCKTCKKNYKLGYGSYTTWLDGFAKGEYESMYSPHKDLPKNKAYYKCLCEHEGHDCFSWSKDWVFEHNGNLVWEGVYGEYHVLCERFTDFEQIDMEEDG